MIKPIVKDVLFLGEKSTMATKDDIQVVNDLIDTLRANLDGCGCKYDRCKKEYNSFCHGRDDSSDDKSCYNKKRK